MSQKLKLIKKFTSWNDFPKYIINSLFRKTLQAHQDKSQPTFTEKQKEPVLIYYGDKGYQLTKS